MTMVKNDLMRIALERGSMDDGRDQFIMRGEIKDRELYGERCATSARASLAGYGMTEAQFNEFLNEVYS